MALIYGACLGLALINPLWGIPAVALGALIALDKLGDL
jgi:hypothetical protein